jgi:hypothetical protein
MFVVLYRFPAQLSSRFRTFAEATRLFSAFAADDTTDGAE